MRAFIQFMIRCITAFFGTGLIGLVAFLPLDQGLLLSSLYSVAGGAITYLSVNELQKFQTTRKHGLSRREYKFITNNLKEAKQKINRLQRALVRIRTVSEAKENLQLIQTVRKIYTNTKREPSRFYQAENFYYKTLDSLVELSEKYAFLSSQPGRTAEMNRSLQDTKQTIHMLRETVTKDLHVMLNDDIDTLHFELDVAKQSYKKIDKNNRKVF